MSPSTDSSLLHRVNGQLLKVVQRQLDMILDGWSSESWIANVIVLHRDIERAEEAELLTSATLFKRRIFDNQEDCQMEEGVGDLERPVPLVRSFSGYCIRTGNVVWVDDLRALRPHHPLYREYRSFEFVGVIPDTHPAAEYVFPVRAKIGVSETLIGVLNIEWCADRTENQFETSGRRDHITHALIRLLDVHGPFMALSMMPEVRRSTPAEEHDSDLERLHARVLEEQTASLEELLESHEMPLQGVGR